MMTQKIIRTNLGGRAEAEPNKVLYQWISADQSAETWPSIQRPSIFDGSSTGEMGPVVTFWISHEGYSQGTCVFLRGNCVKFHSCPHTHPTDQIPFLGESIQQGLTIPSR